MRSKNLKKGLALCLALSVTTHILCQNNRLVLKKLIAENKILKPHLSATKVDSAWHTLLGELTFENKKLLAIAEFKKNKAAYTWHGHSFLYITDKTGTIIYTINFGFPEELPISLTNNDFNFTRVGKIISVPFKIHNKNLFCVSNTECYEITEL